MILQSEIDELIDSFTRLLNNFDTHHLENQINELEAQLALPDAWDDPNNAAKQNQKLASFQNILQQSVEIKKDIENLKVAIEIGEDAQAQELYTKLQKQKTQLEKETYLGGKFDSQGAILSFHAGAGGVDAQDWAGMLLSMYQSFAKKMNWEARLIALSAGDEGGIKSATLEISGEKAYGILKDEAGVHRLVRLSPFNSGNTRETSFALLEIIPDNVAQEVEEIKIDEQDLKWDTFMSSGKGGQSVNTTYSAVRLTHIPTGIVVTCQNERNQIQNKQTAIKYLKNKLAVLEAKKQDELKQDLRGEFQSAEWSNQIRNYVMHPYKLVKDNRSGFESSEVEKILEGEILDIIWSVKKALKDKTD